MISAIVTAVVARRYRARRGKTAFLDQINIIIPERYRKIANDKRGNGSIAIDTAIIRYLSSGTVTVRSRQQFEWLK